MLTDVSGQISQSVNIISTRGISRELVVTRDKNVGLWALITRPNCITVTVLISTYLFDLRALSSQTQSQLHTTLKV